MNPKENIIFDYKLFNFYQNSFFFSVPPQSITFDAPTSRLDPKDGIVTVTCSHGEGNPEPTTTITKDGTTVGTAGSYNFTPSSSDHGLVLKCKVSNTQGELTSQETLSVKSKFED